MWVIIAMLGCALGVVGFAWWIRRHLGSIDGYDGDYEKREENRDPPIFQGPDGPP